MYNKRFTSAPFSGEIKFDKSVRAVTTPEGECLCGVSKKSICDLNGAQIAKYTHKEKLEENGEKLTVRKYASRYGEFAVKGNALYLGSELLGTMPSKKRRAPLILLGAAGVLLAVTIAIIALIDLPYDEVPIIDVKDDNGDWKAQGTIAVLDETIKPGSAGEYEFIIRNANEVKLRYAFGIAECYNGEADTESFPLEYRVRVNNGLIGSEKWLPASELVFEDLIFMPQSDYLVALEWRWQFESGNDALDTYFGTVGGEYTLDLTLTAESISEIV